MKKLVVALLSAVMTLAYTISVFADTCRLR